MKGRVWFHRCGAVFWALMVIPALIWWSDSVAFVIIASVYANIKSDWGAAEAADDRQVVDLLERIDQRLRRLELSQPSGSEATQDLSQYFNRLPPNRDGR